MWISETTGKYFFYRIRISIFNKWISIRNTIVTVRTVISAWINTNNSPPYFFGIVAKKLVTLFCAAAITYANVQ